MKKDSFKHYYKLITLLIILSTVPVIIVGVFSYLRSSEVIQANVAKEKQQSVYQIQTNVEQVLKNVDHSLTHFISSQRVKEVLRDPLTAENFMNYHDIKQDLLHFQTLDTGIQDVILVSLENRWLINNNGLVRLEDTEYSKVYSMYMDQRNVSSWILEAYEDIVFHHDARSNCPYYINLVKQLPILSSEKTGIVGVLIPTCTLTPIMVKQAESETFLIFNDSLQVIAHSDSNNVGKNLTEIDEFIPLADLDAKAGQFEVTLHELDYKATYRTSEYNGWTYLSLVKISDLNKESRAIGWFTLFICTLLLILSLIVSIVGTSIIYKPIRHLQEFINKSFTPKSSEQSQNEFETIKSNIEQMLHQNVELQSRLQNQVSQLKSFFIIRLLQGKVNKEEIDGKLASFNYNQTWNKLSIFTIQIDTLKETNYQKKEEDVLLFAINAMIEDILEDDKRFTPVVLNQSQITILTSNFDTEELYNSYLNKLAQMIQTKVKNEFGFPVSIGISLPFNDLAASKEAYKESLEALKYRLKLGTESIIFYDNLDRNYPFNTQLPTNIKNTLFDAIKVAERLKADKELQKLFNSLFEKGFHHNQYQITLIKFLYDLMELKQIMGIELKELDERPILVELESLKTSDEMQKWFKDNLIYPLIDKIEERTESQYKTISDKIIHIIQREYDEDISLDAIAARLHYNPNYLSSIFQKEMNISFSEYLLMYRLDIAKKWLLGTDLSVKDIALKLRYNNSQNFIRSFRKMEGITPGKYRKDYKK